MEKVFSFMLLSDWRPLKRGRKIYINALEEEGIDGTLALFVCPTTKENRSLLLLLRSERLPGIGIVTSGGWKGLKLDISLEQLHAGGIKHLSDFIEKYRVKHHALGITI